MRKELKRQNKQPFKLVLHNISIVPFTSFKEKKMHSKRFILAISLVAILSMLLSACGAPTATRSCRQATNLPLQVWCSRMTSS